ERTEGRGGDRRPRRPPLRAERERRPARRGDREQAAGDERDAEHRDQGGRGSHCSIASGEATPTRGRLVRREALEVALYTFKFAPSIDSVAAFMPPAPGQSTS